MNENGASAALLALAGGDDRKLDELCGWLAQRGDIGERYLLNDLRGEARSSAKPSGDGGLNTLLDNLANRADSLLVAFFPTAKTSEVFELPNALLGPSGELASAAPSERALDAWPADNATLAVLTRHPAQGRLGAIRTAAWLQTVLGAIGLASYAYSQTLTPLARCPVHGTAMFLSTPDGIPDVVDHAAVQSESGPPTAILAELLSSQNTRELLLDATARTPSDLPQQRLTTAARWLQIAASAVGTADAMIALGIALETITGDSLKGAIVERVTKRSAVFLSSGAPFDERGDIYFDELKRAKKFYELRSRVAHGQFDEWATDQDVGDDDRNEFHRFVLDVALGFRRHTRDRNIRNTDDFTNWWKRVELDGLFA